MTPFASGARPIAVSFGPLRIRAYELIISAYVAEPASPGQSRSPATVLVSLSHAAGRPTGIPGILQFVQSHDILLQHGVRVDVASNLTSARVSANLRRYGKIDLSLTKARQRTNRGCPRLVHAAEATGTFRLTLGGSYFGTIARSRLPGAIVDTTGCETRVAERDTISTLGLRAQQTSTNGTERNVELDPYAPWTITLSRPDGDVQETDAIAANAPPASALTAQPDLSSATFSAFGPFLTGSATYTASAPLMNGETTGTLSGTLTAKFDSPGPVNITNPPLAASLSGP